MYFCCCFCWVQNRLMPFKSVYSSVLMVCWPCMNSMYGNWPVIVSLQVRTLDVEIYRNICELLKKLKNSFTMKASIQPQFSPNFWKSKHFTIPRVGDFTPKRRIVDLTISNIWPYICLDGISTCLNVNGSQDGCALDCPTTDEGCVKATCCQTNNKVNCECD